MLTGFCCVALLTAPTAVLYFASALVQSDLALATSAILIGYLVNYDYHRVAMVSNLGIDRQELVTMVSNSGNGINHSGQ